MTMGRMSRIGKGREGARNNYELMSEARVKEVNGRGQGRKRLTWVGVCFFHPFHAS